jgi:hypothetical protein
VVGAEEHALFGDQDHDEANCRHGAEAGRQRHCRAVVELANGRTDNAASERLDETLHG